MLSLFGLRRRSKVNDTFVQATGGGWDGPHCSMEIGCDADIISFVRRSLEQAREYADRTGLDVGEEFSFTLTDIPSGLSGPHNAVATLAMRASLYGLKFMGRRDEVVRFSNTML